MKASGAGLVGDHAHLDWCVLHRVPPISSRRRSAAELRHLGPALVPGLLHDRRDLGVGGEALPALGVPVEQRPDAVVLVGVAEHDARPWSRARGACRRPWSRRCSSKRSKSSTVVVARIIVSSFVLRRRRSAPMAGEYLRRRAAAHRANALCGRERGPARRPRAWRPPGCARRPCRTCAGRGARRSSRRCRGRRRSPGWTAPRTSASSTSSSRGVSPAGSSRGRLADAVAGRCEHGVDRLGVEPALLRLAQQLGLGGRRRRAPAGAAVLRAWRCSSPRRRACGRPGRVPARAAAVVAGSVEPLVVRAGHRADRSERRGLGEGALGVVGVQPDALPLAERRAGPASPRSHSARRPGRGRARARRGARA